MGEKNIFLGEGTGEAEVPGGAAGVYLWPLDVAEPVS